MSEDDPKLLAARRQVAAIKGFYIHLFIYACVMAGLLVINLLTRPPWWMHWPLMGWGIGVIGHAIAVYAPIKMLGTEWEERKIKEIMERS
jgi:fatty acid desaturase